MVLAERGSFVPTDLDVRHVTLRFEDVRYEV
jgi:hypothetical protein